MSVREVSSADSMSTIAYTDINSELISAQGDPNDQHSPSACVELARRVDLRREISTY